METASSSQDSSSSDVNTSSSSYSQGNELSDNAEKLKGKVYDALPTSACIIKDKNSAENTPSSDNSGCSTDSSSSKSDPSSNVESENSKSSKISSEKSESSEDSSSSSRTQNDDLKEIVTSEKEKTSESVLTREECKKTVDEVKTASEDRVPSNDPFNLKVKVSDESSEENEPGEHRNLKNMFGGLKEVAEHSESTSSSDNTEDRKSEVFTSHIVYEVDDEPSSERNVFTATHSRSAFKRKNTSRIKTASPSKKKFSEKTEETLKISPGPSKRGRRRGKTALQTKCKGEESVSERKASLRKRKLSLSPKKVPRNFRGRGRRTRSMPMICTPERAVFTETVAIVKEEDGVRAVTEINAQSRTTYTLDGASEPSITTETVAIFDNGELLPEFRSQAALVKYPCSRDVSLESEDSIFDSKKTQSEYKNDNSEGERKEMEDDLQNSSVTLGKMRGLITAGAKSPKQGDRIKVMGETGTQETLFKTPNQAPFHASLTDTSSESTFNTSGLVTIDVFRRELRSGKHLVTDSFDLEPFDKALERMEKKKSNELSQGTSTDSCQQNPSKSDEDSSEDDINKSISASGRVMKRYRIESSDEETRVMKNFERKKLKLCEDKQKETSSRPSDITHSILEEDLYLSESTSQTPETSPDESNKRSPLDDGKTRNIKSSRADIKDSESSKKKLTYRKIDTSSESDEISGTENRQLKISKSEPTAVLLEKCNSPKSVSKSSESETPPEESPVKSSEESDTTTPSSKSSGSEENSEECSEDYGKDSKLPKKPKRYGTLKSNVKTPKSETSPKEIVENLKHSGSSKESTGSQSSSQNSKHDSSNESNKTLESETSSEESSEKSSEDKQKETSSSPSDVTNNILEEDLYLSESTCETPETSKDESNKRSPLDDGKTRNNIKSSRADSI